MTILTSSDRLTDLIHEGAICPRCHLRSHRAVVLGQRGNE